MATLQQVQRIVPVGTTQVLGHLLASCPAVVLGYSGRDDFDLYQTLLGSKHPSAPPVFWIQHANTESDWRVFRDDTIATELERIAEAASDSDYYSDANPLAIVESRGGAVLRAHTAGYLQTLVPHLVDWSTGEAAGDVESIVRQRIESWAFRIGSSAKKRSTASLFEAAGTPFLSFAREDVESPDWPGTDDGELTRDLALGRLTYKAGDPQRFDDAQARLRSVAQSTSNLSMTGEANLLLALLLNRRAATEPAIIESCESARHAIEVFFSLAEMDDRYLFELGTALRAQALAMHRSVPDLESIADQNRREKCHALLMLALEHAEASLRVVDRAGNYLGERGQGQCLNIMGLIHLKMGTRDSLLVAMEEFQKFIELTSRSGRGFEREAFQGRRNLGLTLRALARTESGAEKARLLATARGNFEQAAKILDRTSGARADVFNTRFNAILTDVETAKDAADCADLLGRLEAVEADVPKDRQGRASWHWTSWVSATAARAAFLSGRHDEAIRRVEIVIEGYERTPSEQIESQVYGVQNGRTNLATCKGVIESIGGARFLMDRILSQSARMSTLDQRVPDIDMEKYRQDLGSMLAQLAIPERIR